MSAAAVNQYALMGRIGGYTTAARYGREAAVARGRKSVADRWARFADPVAAMREHMAKMALAAAQARQARAGTRVK